MIDHDEPGSADKLHQRAYDFFKHLTGVSLISLGGITGLLGEQGPEVPKAKLIMLMTCIGLAGAVSLFTAASIVGTVDLGERSPISTKSVRRAVQVAVWSLAVGLGAAIQTFAVLLM
jgi:hypothetical protein